MSAAYNKLAQAVADVSSAEDHCAAAQNAPGLPGVGNRAGEAPIYSTTLICNKDATLNETYLLTGNFGGGANQRPGIQATP
jgi:hypothetical protein